MHVLAGYCDRPRMYFQLGIMYKGVIHFVLAIKHATWNDKWAYF